MAAINTDKTEREASKKGLVDNFGRQTISDNAAYVASLSEEDRWRLVGRTYDQEQAFRAAHDQNPDGTAKFTQENIIGGVITVLLVAASAVVVGGLVIGGGAIGGAVLPATGGALPAAAGIAAPVSAIVIPASVPIATTIATTTAVATTIAEVAKESAVEVIKNETKMGLLDTALDLLKSPTVGALTTALTGNNSNAAQQSAAQTQQIYDKLNKVAEDALTAAQNAALGQKNTTTTQTSTGIMSYIWWIVGGVFFFFMMLLLLLFGGRRK